jgi:hypothetical protein
MTTYSEDKQVSELTAGTSLASADKMVYFEDSGSIVKAITKTNFVSDILSGYATESYVDALVPGLTYAEINIGDWNMDSTATLAVAHGLSGTEYLTIREISVFIRNDANDTIYPLGYLNTEDVSGIDGYEGVLSIDSTNINLRRSNNASSRFDNTNFDSTSYNRGWIRIGYTAD